MSKTVLLFQFLLVIVIVSAPLYAQIPNNGFEQWDQSEPTDWVTSNLWWLKTVSKTENSHSGLSALKLQTADFTDEKEVKVLLSSLRHDLDLLHEHAVNEDNIIFPEISDEEPQMIEVLNEEHKKLESKLNNLLVLIEKTELSNSIEERMLLGNSLNSLFNDFIADYLAHMNHEEATVLEASFKYLTDEELIAIRTRIQSNVPPDRYKVWMNWMLRSLNNTELVGLLGSMKTSAPSNVFDYILDATKSVLDSERWLKMKLSLGA